MSEFDKDWLDELKPKRASEKPEKAPRKAKRTQSKAKTSTKPVEASEPREEPRGKRAKDNYAQVNAGVPQELKASAFAYLTINAQKAKRLRRQGKDVDGIPTNLSDLVEQLLKEWVDEQGGVLPGLEET